MTTQTLTPGTRLELTIDSLATGGKAIGRHEGMAVFIDRGLPGQTVVATVTRVKKRFAEATFEHVLTRSSDEIAPFCSHFGLCGGCLWQHLPYTEQLRWKHRFVEDSVRRIGGATTTDVRPVIPSPRQTMYRNKMEFAFLQGRGTIHLGLRRYNSHSVVNIQECHLQSARSVAIVQFVRDWCNARDLLTAYDPRTGKGYLRFLVIRETCHSDQLMIQIITAPDWSGKFLRTNAMAELGRALAEAFPGLTGFVHSERSSKTQVAYGERTVAVQGTEELRETVTVGSTVLDLGIGGADAFFQTNTEAAEQLFTQAIGMAGLTGAETVWDLYCGVGALSLAAAAQAACVVGFELSRAAVDAATRNAETLGMHHASFRAGDVLHTMADESTRPDVIIADPPRGGMHPDVVRAIADSNAARLVLIACDPATQARDLSLLLEHYSIDAIQPVDLFPHTPHVENIVVLQRR